MKLIAEVEACVIIISYYCSLYFLIRPSQIQDISRCFWKIMSVLIHFWNPHILLQTYIKSIIYKMWSKCIFHANNFQSIGLWLIKIVSNGVTVALETQYDFIHSLNWTGVVMLLTVVCEGVPNSTKNINFLDIFNISFYVH